jgi:hypothetical protein
MSKKPDTLDLLVKKYRLMKAVVGAARRYQKCNQHEIEASLMDLDDAINALDDFECKNPLCD